jgi:hypothetical protein
MPRYFFNVMDGRPLVDKDGIELPDAAAARREATKYAAELMRKRAGLNARDEVGNVVVTDERGAEVLTVTFPKSAAERCDT